VSYPSRSRSLARCDMAADAATRFKYFQVGLQNFEPQAASYDLIWIQVPCLRGVSRESAANDTIVGVVLVLDAS